MGSLFRKEVARPLLLLFSVNRNRTKLLPSPGPAARGNRVMTLHDAATADFAPI
jgi:hypothetical protein